MPIDKDYSQKTCCVLAVTHAGSIDFTIWNEGTVVKPDWWCTLDGDIVSKAKMEKVKGTGCDTFGDQGNGSFWSLPEGQTPMDNLLDFCNETKCREKPTSYGGGGGAGVDGGSSSMASRSKGKGTLRLAIELHEKSWPSDNPCKFVFGNPKEEKLTIEHTFNTGAECPNKDKIVEALKGNGKDGKPLVELPMYTIYSGNSYKKAKLGDPKNCATVPVGDAIIELDQDGELQVNFTMLHLITGVATYLDPGLMRGLRLANAIAGDATDTTGWTPDGNGCDCE